MRRVPGATRAHTSNRQRQLTRVDTERWRERLAASPWVARLARLGYAAKGLLYVIVGGTLAFAATGFGGRPVGLRGALRVVVAQPFGRVGVALVALGLFGFILRRGLQVFVPPAGEPKWAMMRALRPIGYVFSGVGNVGVALTALQLVLGWTVRHPADRAPTRDWTVWLTATSADGWLVLLVGLAILGFAVFHLYLAASGRFCIDIHVDRMSARARRATFACGRTGYAALGIAFLITGGTITYAGWLADTRQVRGVGAALLSLEALPFGTTLLMAVAIGVIAHGLYLVCVARYLRVIATW